MRDSLAGAAIALRAILLAVCREARGPFAQGGWHAKRHSRGGYYRLLAQYAQVCVRMLCRTGANSWRGRSAQTVMGFLQVGQDPPEQPAQCAREPSIGPRRVP